MNNNLNKIYIEPSLNFTKKTMSELGKVAERRQFYKRAVVTTAALTPSLTREAWMFVRGDYIAVSSLPMGEVIAGAYRAFITPATGYVFVAMAASVPIIYLATKFGGHFVFKK